MQCVVDFCDLTDSPKQNKQLYICRKDEETSNSDKNSCEFLQEEMDTEQMERMIDKLKAPVFYEDPAVVPEDETEEQKYERKKRLARKV